MRKDARASESAEDTNKNWQFAELPGNMFIGKETHFDRLVIVQKCFSTIFDSCLSRKEMWLLSHIQDFDSKKIKKLKRSANVSKYHKEDFMKKNGLDEIDDVLLKIESTPSQMTIFTETFR